MWRCVSPGERPGPSAAPRPQSFGPALRVLDAVMGLRLDMNQITQTLLQADAGRWLVRLSLPRGKKVSTELTDGGGPGQHETERFRVMAGLVPAIPTREAQALPSRSPGPNPVMTNGE